MAAPTTAFEQLQGFLKAMFQFGDNDLDFGIYRITRLKRQFIEAFIDGEGENSLRATVTRALSGARDQQVEMARQSLAAFSATLGEKGKTAWDALDRRPGDEEALAGFRKLLILADSDAEREQAEAHLATLSESAATTTEDLEARVYNHLLNFFELYYADGDFGYNTRATKAFKVPYEADYDGTDTLFHWKHKDSYYVKTGNGFGSVRFQVAGQWVEFCLQAGGDTEAETTARNNNRGDERKHYRLVGVQPTTIAVAEGKSAPAWQVCFVLARESTSKVEIYPALWHAAFGANQDLTAYLHKKPDSNHQAPGAPVFNDLSGDYDKADGGRSKGLGQLRLKRDDYLKALAQRDEFKALGSNADKRQEALEADDTAAALWEIDRRLNQFYVGNDADYFIHKDLQGFLTREKARFIKSVVFSDLTALLHAGEDNLVTLIARAFNDVADTLIGFLAAIENFQKNLFELKKKVVGTHYLISVGRIPAEFHARIAANADQLREWKDLYKLEITGATQLADHPSLVVDTSLYRESDPTLQAELLSHPAFDHLDEQTDGLLINSENWQALNLLQESFRERIKCIYIDPPYNTGGDGFLYKDSFRHSSWASMIHDRLAAAKPLLARNGVLFASIDEKERTQLELQLKQTFGAGNRVEELIWAQNSTKNQSPTYSTNHEYVQVYARDLDAAKADPLMFREPKPGFAEMMELVDRLNPDYPPIAEIEAEIARLFDEHRETFREELEEQGIEFDKNLDLWKGLYNYKRAEYRDADGRFVPEVEAKKKRAQIAIWREDNPSMPAGKQADSTRDPEDENYRFYQPKHPVTGELCRLPKTGWRWPFKQIAGRPSFSQFNKDFRIVWGEDDSKVPQYKRFLTDVETAVSKSVVIDYTDGEKELTALLGKSRSFPNPKPTTLIERFVQQTTGAGEWVLDFFAGSGTTGQAVLRSDEKRRFILTEMGAYFDSILVPRIKRVMYATQWKDGAPLAANRAQHLVKVQRLEQYEDTLDNLQPVWDGAELPALATVRYLFRPEAEALHTSLDLAWPFAQTLRTGKGQEATPIDLMETWCYLQGHRMRSRRRYTEFDRVYEAVETTQGVLVVLRDIAPGEDDTDNLKALLARYVNENGTRRIQRLELNLDADLRQLQEVEVQLIRADDFMRGTTWS